MFANPGSTEVPLLCRPLEGIRFVLALHEGSVVGAATGYAIGAGRPALALLHTTAGLGNAVSALATARRNRAPLVVVVGQQDRRHLANEPFLAGRLRGLAGEYPVWFCEPAIARDVPNAIDRAWHEARDGRGPAIVVVPMDDWDAAADAPGRLAAREVRHVGAVDADDVRALASILDAAENPAIVSGSDTDDAGSWAALESIAARLRCPVFQEAFGARAGFPQDHAQFAGHLPADRTRLRRALAAYDVVLVVGAPAFRQYPFDDGPLVEPGTRLLMVTEDPAHARFSPVELAVVGPIEATCRAMAAGLRGRSAPAASPTAPAAVAASARPGPRDGALSPADVFTALAATIDADTVVVEETPSSRPELHRLLPARAPLGFVSAAMGGLGFALPAAAGLRLALPERPVVAVVGDGSALYAPQALWTAVRYRIGVLYVVLVNHRYSVMDRLAERRGEPGPWPDFAEVDVAAAAVAFGCDARRVTTSGELDDALSAVAPTLRARDTPLVLAVDVVDAPDFAP